ncbi:DUF4012 domain-containing protein [Microbacterium sp. No. 7]|uniref:DUF4012 domain-containing protein n=1 Tax=Microbacterium sp. No. 7 TaxID=1714373 RepID=UPI0006ECE8D3|nr:DUF4012 domain-containing protein [Microbacterium sp. No. 7]ALJ19107.1 hypothetical protein AOA12_03985 [Microbacterium sp. No. 7]
MGNTEAPLRRDRSNRAPAPVPAPARTRRPLLKSFRLWIPVTIVVLLIAGAVVAAVAGKALLDRAYAARDALEEAIPLASVAKQQILDGDTAGAQATAERLASLTATARAQTGGRLWSYAEALPIAGTNLTAVRTVAAVVDDLVTDAVTPATGLSIASLAPVDGRIDTAALAAASDIVDRAADAVVHARAEIDGVDRDGLIDQVSGGLTRLDDAIADLEPLIEPAQQVLAVLPGVLGADAPRNYLVMVQNNAESRGTGGNPAALVVINADDGAISIAEQASSQDFENGRPWTVTDLDPETEALYGDKVGRYMQDVTMTPDFAESARIMRAFWDESFGTPIDAAVSIDPVALSYILRATGPVTLETGEQLTADNVVPLLLNEVYFRFDEPEMQDAYFAMAAKGVFDALTSVSDVKTFVTEISRAVDEGRIMYVPASEAEAALIAGSRLDGRLPADNVERTMVGVYVNDNTASKLDYYLDVAAGVATDVCQAEGLPTFTVNAQLTSTVRADEVEGLPEYVSSGRFFPKGDISTFLVLYGPVGGTFERVTVDGEPVEGVAVAHLGRPAVKVEVLNTPESTRTVQAVFTGTDGEYGPVELWHTPMARATPVTIDAPGCAAPE